MASSISLKSLALTSTDQDSVVSTSEPVATPASPNNSTPLATPGMGDVQTNSVHPIPGSSGPKRTLLGWLKQTEIRTNLLTLVITLLGLAMTIIYGTSTWIQSSISANATAKANRLALFTACISFPDQPNIVNSTFCKTNSNTTLDAFAKRDMAAISPPLLWELDAFADALQIVQPAWQCKAVCTDGKVHHLPGLSHVLSLTRENCHLDCFEHTQTIFWAKKLVQKFETPMPVIVIPFIIIILLLSSRKYISTSTLGTIITAITYTCPLFCLASFIPGPHHVLFQRSWLELLALKLVTKTSIGIIKPSELYRFLSLSSKPPSWLRIIGWALSVFHILERGPFTIDTALLLVTHTVGLNLQYLFCLFCYRLVKGHFLSLPSLRQSQPVYIFRWNLLYIVILCGLICGVEPWIWYFEEYSRRIVTVGRHGFNVLVLRIMKTVMGKRNGRTCDHMVDLEVEDLSDNTRGFSMSMSMSMSMESLPSDLFVESDPEGISQLTRNYDLAFMDRPFMGRPASIISTSPSDIDLDEGNAITEFAAARLLSRFQADARIVEFPDEVGFHTDYEAAYMGNRNQDLKVNPFGNLLNAYANR